MARCKIKQHFECDGSGQTCAVCGESAYACGCDEDEQELDDCEGCEGGGYFCVEHDSPCGNPEGPCDAKRR